MTTMTTVPLNLDLSPDYLPYRRLVFCGNELENVRVPLLLKGHPVLLVGSGGQQPRIWLGFPLPDGRWGRLVEDNGTADQSAPETALTPVKVYRQQDSVEVLVGNLPIVKAQQESPILARVQFIDLRPLGLNIFGSAATGLSVGSANFSQNASYGSGVWINGG
jgi:hypothetical protein